MVEQCQSLPAPQRGGFAAALDSDLLHAFLRSKITVAAALITVVLVLATILYGSRISLSVGVLSVGLAAAVGIVLGLIAGYAGGFLDALIMRIADVQLTFPAILIALLIDGTVRALFGAQRNETLEFWVLVIATINLALAIITEATLSFLGVGLPPTQPSLGTLIRIGNNFLFAGEWWIAIFPGITLALLVLAVNLLGDWLRDALNPRLR